MAFGKETYVRNINEPHPIRVPLSGVNLVNSPVPTLGKQTIASTMKQKTHRNVKSIGIEQLTKQTPVNLTLEPNKKTRNFKAEQRGPTEFKSGRNVDYFRLANVLKLTYLITEAAHLG